MLPDSPLVADAELIQDPAALLRSPAFRRLWIAQIAFQLGSSFIDFGLMGVFTLRFGVGFGLSMLFFLWRFPAVLFGPLSGVLADRWAKPRGMRMATLVRTVAMGILLAGLHLPVVLVGMTLASSFAYQWFTTTEAAYLPDLIAGPALLRANSLYRAAEHGTTFVAASVAFAGLGLGTLGSTGADASQLVGGPWLMPTVAAGLFVLSGVLLSSRSLPTGLARRRTGSPWAALKADLAEGFRYVRRAPAIRGLVIHLSVVQMLLLGLMTVAIPYGAQVLRVDATGAAMWLLLPTFLGLILGIALLGRVVPKLGLRRVLGVGTIMGGVLLGVFGGIGLAAAKIGGWSGLHGLSFGLSLPLGVGFIWAMVPAQTALQSMAKAGQRGRVFGLLSGMTASVAALPLLVIGRLVDTRGVGVTEVVLSAVTLVYAGWFLYHLAPILDREAPMVVTASDSPASVLP